MPEEERLTLVSEVEDSFTEPLERLEGSLESVDDEIRQTGKGRDLVRIDVETRGIESAIGEIEALNTALESLDDDVTVDVDSNVQDTVDVDAGRVDIDTASADVDAATSTGGELATGGGQRQRMFTIENIDEWGEALGPYLDHGALGRRGGEVTRIEATLDRDLDDVIDLDTVVRRAADPDDTDIRPGMVRALMEGPDEAVDAIEGIADADGNMTLLGSGASSGKQMRRLWREVADLRFTMGSFHQIIASLIPLVGVFVGALPAAIVGVGALATAAIGAAAALAGVAGLGALGMMVSETGGLDTEPLMERLREVGDTFLDAFSPLANSFAPIVEDAISDVEAMAGPLSDASAALLAFRDDFTGVVDYLTGALPSFTRDFLEFAHAAEPVVASVISAISGVDWMGYFATQLQRALPALTAIGWAMMQILPAIVNLSQGFLMVAAGITAVAGIITSLTNHFPVLTAVIGAVIGSMLLLVTATTLYTIATSGLMAQSLGLAKTLLASLVPSLKASAASMWTSMVAAWGFQRALAAVIATATLGLGAIAMLASEFDRLTGNIGGARSELEKFANGQNALNTDVGLPNGSSSPTSTGANAYYDNSTTVINSGSRDDAARQQYSNEYERRQHRDSVFGG